MEAVWIREFGDPEVLELRRVAMPEPEPGQVRVRVAASGVNRADLLQRRGHYPPPPGYPPEIPGLEFAGVVEAVGPGVRLWSAGDRVMGITGGGGYAGFVIARERELVVVPEGLSLVEAGGVPEVYMTAFDALFSQAGLQAGETVLVHAVGSGVGTAALQLARRAGARVLGTSRSDWKLDRAAESGLHFPIPGDERWEERVREATEGRGVDVILDLVGGAYLDGNLKALTTGGRQVVVGVPSGSAAEIDLRRLMTRRALVRGTVLRPRPPEEKAHLARTFQRRVLAGFRDGTLNPILDRALPPSRAPEAHRALEGNEVFGKIVLDWEAPP